MKSSSWLSAVSAAVLVSGLAASAAHAKKQAEAVPGEIIVGMKHGFAPLDSKKVLTTALVQVLGSDAIRSVTPLQMDASIQKIVLRDPTKRDAAISQLKNTLVDTVRYAEPNFIYHADVLSKADLALRKEVKKILDGGEPNDPDFAKQWDMENTGQEDKPMGKKGSAGSDINIVPLWKEGITSSKNILVAIIDTGIDYTHPQLAANMFKNTKEIAGNGVDDDGNGVVDDVYGADFSGDAPKGNGLDDNNHGSHCAGTIGAVGNDGMAISGVNWEATLMPSKFLTADGSGSLDAAINAIKYATRMGAKVMSNSWGGGGYSDALKEAIQEAGDAGALFVAAAGNDGADNDSDPHYPAAYDLPNVLAVAATDNTDTIAYFSNYGAKSVHVAAPGVNILSTVKDGGYDIYSGTSMATPHVSGIAALVWSQNPDMTYADVKKRLIETSTPVASLRRKSVSGGRINAYNAYHNIVTPTDEPKESDWKTIDYSVESAHPYANSSNVTFEVKATGAKYLRVVFDQVETEATYDTVTFEDDKGAVIETLSGTKTAGYVTDYVKADHAVIRLKSDTSVNKFGFKISKIQIVE